MSKELISQVWENNWEFAYRTVGCGLQGREQGTCSVGFAPSVTSSLSPQEPQRHQRRAEGTCHCRLHPPPRPHSWTLHPSGLQTSASPSEVPVSKDQNMGWGGGVRVSCRERLDLLVLLRSSLGVPSSFLLSSFEEDPDLASFPRRG